MDSQKTENLLNLALDSTEEEREKSLNLQVGYDPGERTWELIVKYDQTVGKLPEELADIVPLSYGYGIIRVPESMIERIAALEIVEYIEKPKRLFFAVNRGKAASCFLGLPGGAGVGGGGSGEALTGRGIIVALIDSGVDYFHPDFRNEDGSTRILALWDQTASMGRPPEGFRQGTEFSREEIDQALRSGSRGAGYGIVPSEDRSGHGTQVLGIAAGNGNASGGRYAGGAPESQILAVKLGVPGERDFPSTTQLMQAVEYVMRKAYAYRLPVVVNLSFGNVYGSHSGTSLVETYLNQMAGTWKNVIVAGSGNEGAGRGHTSGTLEDYQILTVELAVAEFEPVLNLQLWKNYVDDFEITLIHPGGQRVILTAGTAARAGSAGAGGAGTDNTGSGDARVGGVGAGGREAEDVRVRDAGAGGTEAEDVGVRDAGAGGTEAGDARVGGVGAAGTGIGGVGRYRLGTTELLVYFGEPAPYNVNQEIYLDFIPMGTYIDPGIWKIELMPRRIVQGDFDMWLPAAEALGAGTGFLRPSPDVTLTIPSTAEKVLTVGAYNAHTMSYAPFSGRGNTRYPEKIKPDLVAPGVDITTTAPGGGYAPVTGTSFAAPFASAAAALLMQWGIQNGNDPYLYGEKVKAYLRKGARPLPGFTQYPNPQIGWGTLCVRESLPR